MGKLIFSIVSLVAAGGIFFYYTQGTFDQVNALNVDIAQYDQALQKANELQQIKQKLLATYNSFQQSDLDRLQKLLPDHVDNVRLILDIDHLAQSHQMALQNVVINAGAAQPSSGATIAASKGSDKTDSLTLKFSTEGTYDQFTSFLDDLESSLRIVDLVAFSLTPSGQAAGGDPVFRYDITIRTYWLK